MIDLADNACEIYFPEIRDGVAVLSMAAFPGRSQDCPEGVWGFGASG